MNDEEFLSRLQELAMGYDRAFGDYPEDKYEGFAVFYCIKSRLEGKNSGDEFVGDDYEAAKNAWSKEVAK